MFFVIAVGQTRIVFSKWPGRSPPSDVSDKSIPESKQKETITTAAATDKESIKPGIKKEKKEPEESPQSESKPEGETNAQKTESIGNVPMVASSESWVIVGESVQPHSSQVPSDESKESPASEKNAQSTAKQTQINSPVKEFPSADTTEKPPPVTEPVQVKQAWDGTSSEDGKEQKGQPVSSDPSGSIAADPMAVEDIEEEETHPRVSVVQVKRAYTPAKGDQCSDDEEVFSTPNAVLPQVCIFITCTHFPLSIIYGTDMYVLLFYLLVSKYPRSCHNCRK